MYLYHCCDPNLKRRINLPLLSLCTQLNIQEILLSNEVAVNIPFAENEHFFIYKGSNNKYNETSFAMTLAHKPCNPIEALHGTVQNLNFLRQQMSLSTDCRALQII